MRALIGALLAVLYFAGVVYLNEEVASARTHGNCVHGWYSNSNKVEKALFVAWALGFPALPCVSEH